MKYIVTARIIYISFNPRRSCVAMGIEDGVVRATGNLEEVKEKMGNVTVNEYPDLVIMPGFIDAHMHLDDFGKYLSIIDLRGITSIEEMKSKISTSVNGNGWILGHGWDQDLFSEKRWPVRDDLDSAQSVMPVFLSRVDLHSAVINSVALREMNLEEKFADNPNLVRDSRGRITGVLSEEVFGYADDWIKDHTPERRWEVMLENAESEANKLGVTAVGFMSCTSRMYSNLLRLKAKGRLSLRIHAYISSDDFSELEYFGGDEFLKISGVKAFADGSLGSRTALLSFPYRDDVKNHGQPRESRGAIFSNGKLAEKRGMDIGTHAIGDLALDIVLSVYEELDQRHRIEHASLVRKDQLSKIKECNAILVIQPHFIMTDFWTLNRIGEDNAGIAYPFNTIMMHGIQIAISTDCPVENLNPWETVYAAVTRGSNEGIPLGTASREESLTIEQTLDAYTQGAAAALRNTDIGALLEGKLADFIVLDKDPLTVTERELLHISVKSTWVNGKRVWPN
ncbi:MAG: amidohydrolase family protein [Thermoplasmataceae archaeon]